MIADWTIAEEAKYHATLISEDVEQDMTDAAKLAAAASKDAKKASRGRSKSPKGGRKGSGRLQISTWIFNESASLRYYKLPIWLVVCLVRSVTIYFLPMNHVYKCAYAGVGDGSVTIKLLTLCMSLHGDSYLYSQESEPKA